MTSYIKRPNQVSGASLHPWLDITHRDGIRCRPHTIRKSSRTDFSSLDPDIPRIAILGRVGPLSTCCWGSSYSGCLPSAISRIDTWHLLVCEL